MSAAEPTLLSYIAETVLGLFPYLARFSLRASDKALSIQSANEVIAIDAIKRIDIGEHSEAIVVANGTLPSARKTDSTGYLYAVVSAGAVAAVYYSEKNGVDSAWTIVLSGASPPVDGTTVGTGMRIVGGSGKVTVG